LALSQGDNLVLLALARWNTQGPVLKYIFTHFWNLVLINIMNSGRTAWTFDYAKINLTSTIMVNHLIQELVSLTLAF